MTIKTNSQAVDLPSDSRVQIIAEGRVSVFSMSEDGELDKFLLSSEVGRIDFRVKQGGTVWVEVEEGRHFSVEAFISVETADTTPVEVPEEMRQPEGMEEKLKRFLGGLVHEMYGRDSQQMDSLEEAMDFEYDDLAEEGVLGRATAYEQMEPVDMEPSSLGDQPEPTKGAEASQQGAEGVEVTEVGAEGPDNPPPPAAAQ